MLAFLFKFKIERTATRSKRMKGFASYVTVIIAANIAVLTLYTSCNNEKTTLNHEQNQKRRNLQFTLSAYIDNKTNNKESEIAFVHIGKTGGTSISCLIRQAQEDYKIRRLVCSRVGRPLDGILKSESHISKRVTDAYHTRKDEKYDQFTTYLVTARNPIDRFISWYFYQHPQNGYEEWRENGYLKPSYKVFMCYPQLDQLATIGLQMDKIKIKNFYKNLSNEEQENDAYCKRITNSCISGRDHGSRHMHFNYQWYLNDIVFNDAKQVYVIRTEEQESDWNAINYMLGNDTSNQLGPIKVTHHNNRFTGAAKVQQVDNATMSEEGIHNLCYALCKEMQVYKQLLLKSLNLNEDEKQISINRVADICPLEMSYDNIDQCTF